MAQDVHGMPISTASEAAAGAFNDTLLGYLKYRADTPERMARTLAADPEFGLAHCLQGYFAMTSFKQANVAGAVQAAAKARPLMAGATAREQAHLEALEAWIAGDLDRMIAIWEEILARHPTDVLGRRTLMSYWRLPERLYDDPDELAAWARTALAVAQRGAAAKRKSQAKPTKRGGSVPRGKKRKPARRPQAT